MAIVAGGVGSGVTVGGGVAVGAGVAVGGIHEMGPIKLPLDI